VRKLFGAVESVLAVTIVAVSIALAAVRAPSPYWESLSPPQDIIRWIDASLDTMPADSVQLEAVRAEVTRATQRTAAATVFAMACQVVSLTQSIIEFRRSTPAMRGR